MDRLTRNRQMPAEVVKTTAKKELEDRLKKELRAERFKKVRKIKQLEELKRLGAASNADVIDTQAGKGARHKGTTGKKKNKKK